MADRLVRDMDYIKVLQQLKEYLTDGYLDFEPIQCEFKWDDAVSNEMNNRSAVNQGVVLDYFERAGIIKREDTGRGVRVIYDVDIDRLNAEAKKYGLVDRGTEFAVVYGDDTPVMIPGTQFSFTNRKIFFDNNVIRLEAQHFVAARFLMKSYTDGREFVEVDDIAGELTRLYSGGVFGDDVIQAIISKLRTSFANSTRRDDADRHFASVGRRRYTFEP